MARETREHAEDVFATLEEFYLEMCELLQTTDPEDEDESKLWHLALRAVKQIPPLFDAAQRGDTWEAVQLALRLGVIEGLMQAYPREYHRKRTQRSGAARGGRAKAGHRDADEADIVDVFRRLRSQYPKKSRSFVCSRVGEELQVSAATVRRRLLELGEIS